MSRNPGYPQANLAALQKDSLKFHSRVESYQITVVTPMFGGGYEPGKVDENRPVRESTIRGQLRFWWRATRGAAFASAYELRKREAEIFGDTSCPSRVKIWLGKEPKTDCLKTGFWGFPKYVLYSTGSELEQAKRKAVELTSGHTFLLNVEYKQTDIMMEVEAALWAWINFGGIGSRTRRGCGSLYCKKFSPQEAEVTGQNFWNWFDKKTNEYQLTILDKEQSREWPTLSSKIKVRSHSTSLKSNWDKAVEAYRLYRRRANKKNNFQKPGRSFWPEADSIRLITGKAHPLHKNRFPEDKPEKLVACPRTQFGLPIVFQFKGRAEGEPDPTQLVPKGKDRLSSPIILKPLACNAKEGIGIIAVLNQPVLTSVELVKKIMNKSYKVLHEYTEKEIYPSVAYNGNPMQDSTKKLYISAIDAFLNSEEVEAFCKNTNRTAT